MSEIEIRGQCAANQLDALSLEQPGATASYKCSRKIIQLTCERDIQTTSECRARVQLTEDGITEFQGGVCSVQLACGLARSEFSLNESA